MAGRIVGGASVWVLGLGVGVSGCSVAGVSVSGLSVGMPCVEIVPKVGALVGGTSV